MTVPLVDLGPLEIGEGLVGFQRIVNDQHVGPPPGEDAPDGGGQAKPLAGRREFLDGLFLAREAGPRKQGVIPGTRHHRAAIARMFVGEFLRVAHAEELRRGLVPEPPGRQRHGGTVGFQRTGWHTHNQSCDRASAAGLELGREQIQVPIIQVGCGRVEVAEGPLVERRQILPQERIIFTWAQGE